MSIKKYGALPTLPSFDAVPSWVGPKDTTILVGQTLYVSSGSSWLQSLNLHGEFLAAVLLSTVSTAFSSTATTANSTSVLSAWQYVAANWSGIKGFIFEVYGNVGSVGTAYFGLWDITSGSLVASVSTTNSGVSMLRSTLLSTSNFTDGHVYRLTAWCDSSSHNAVANSANLKAIV